MSELINSAALTDDDRLRLVLLFGLRYERDGRPQIASLLQRCQDFGMPGPTLGAVRTMLQHAGDEQCVPEASLKHTCLAGLVSWKASICCFPPVRTLQFARGQCLWARHPWSLWY